jgi:uncharacterized membrane protein YgaE (UPF0421/DUF939 family)
MSHGANPAAVRSVGTAAARRAQEGLGEVTRSWRIILQATVAATGAYALALAVGHEQPFFAPIAAIATVAVSLAHRLRRSAELLVGNAVGILFADLLIAQIGTGVWQLGLVVAIALVSAVALGGGPILIMQASSAAILIATITPPTDAEPWNTGRVVDALIGGGVGLLVSALLMPVDPAKHARTATDPLLDALADGYRRVGWALRAHDRAAAEAVLADLRATAPVLAGFHAGLDATRESVRLAPWYWGQRALLASYALAGVHLDNALRNLRVIARQAVVAIDRDEPVPAGIPDALEDLSRAAAELGPALAGEAQPDGVQQILLAAVGHSSEATRQVGSGSDRPGLFTAPLVAQVRLSAADLMQACGLTSVQAATAVRAAGDVPQDEE